MEKGHDLPGRSVKGVHRPRRGQAAVQNALYRSIQLLPHSDRGVQYASKTYVDTLKNAGIEISMSRRGNPYDNARAERFIRTLKYEEVYLYEYESLEEARSRIGYFIDKRMQSQALALGPGLQTAGRVRAEDVTC